MIAIILNINCASANNSEIDKELFGSTVMTFIILTDDTKLWTA